MYTLVCIQGVEIVVVQRKKDYFFLKNKSKSKLRFGMNRILSLEKYLHDIQIDIGMKK